MRVVRKEKWEIQIKPNEVHLILPLIPNPKSCFYVICEQPLTLRRNRPPDLVLPQSEPSIPLNTIHWNTGRNYMTYRDCVSEMARSPVSTKLKFSATHLSLLHYRILHEDTEHAKVHSGIKHGQERADIAYVIQDCVGQHFPKLLEGYFELSHKGKMGVGCLTKLLSNNGQHNLSIILNLEH